MRGKDIRGREILSGDKVVCHDYDGVAFGEVSHNTGNSIVIMLTVPNTYKRQINLDLTHKKVYKLDGSN